MKTNKEFIEGIYQKADEISIERNTKKKNNIRKITNIAAVLIIALAIGININANKIQELPGQKENVATEPDKISLKTVDTFENFCSIIKNINTVQDGVYESTNEFLVDVNSSAAYGDSTDSKTNNQVENVDEADIVKVDENYIYYVTEKKIVIIDANKAEESSKIAEIDYTEKSFTPQEMYVNDNKLIVIGHEYLSTSYNTICGIYDLAYGSNKSKTLIIIYDVSNKAEPKEIRTVEVEGTYVSSRMIKNNVYFVTNQYIYSSEITKNEVETLDETNYKPKYKDTAISEEEKCIEFDDIYCFCDIETTNYLMIGGINLEKNEEVEIKTFLGAGSDIYSSENNMYIAKVNIKYENHEYMSDSTHVLKFSLNDGKVQFTAEANIDGRINNQFSMDENGEYFRIATTTGGTLWETTENTTNNLYVLNDKLELVGKVTGFGVGEKIYSVRYVGTKAYVVTFKQTDPLFVIDLADPTNPQILGELKIPGYSTYLHPYDEKHIIGFGYDTKEDGTRITTNGLKMVMFDISDFNNPKELFKVTIGDQHTSSELAYNHKALLHLKEKNIMAFPLNTYYRNEKHTRAAIYEIDLEKGFTLKGEIEHEFTDYKRIVERIVFVNDTYYTLSKTLIKAANMETLEIIKEIEI